MATRRQTEWTDLTHDDDPLDRTGADAMATIKAEAKAKIKAEAKAEAETETEVPLPVLFWVDAMDRKNEWETQAGARALQSDKTAEAFLRVTAAEWRRSLRLHKITAHVVHGDAMYAIVMLRPPGDLSAVRYRVVGFDRQMNCWHWNHSNSAGTMVFDDPPSFVEIGVVGQWLVACVGPKAVCWSLRVGTVPRPTALQLTLGTETDKAGAVPLLMENPNIEMQSAPLMVWARAPLCAGNGGHTNFSL
jgi:hypothetical protein